MINTDDYIKNLKNSLSIEQKKAKNKRVYIEIDAEQFKTLFLLNADIELAKRCRTSNFIIDKQNKEVINQLFFYIVGNTNFKGDLKKGLFLMGNYGTGKTIIISALLNIIEDLSIPRKIITRLHAKEINSKLTEKESEPDFYKTRPLFIDDVGKESHVVNNFGTKINPISDLFAMRYDFGAWTFATSNNMHKELISFYGNSTTDRFKEMFNILILTGDSRR